MTGARGLPILGAFLLALFASRRAVAEGDRPYRLSYDAPASCPREDELRRRIEGATLRARPARLDERAIDVATRVVEIGSAFTGVLHVRALDGSEMSREVPAPTCSEVVSAVALIAAVVIDPDAASAGASPGATASTPPNPATTPVTGTSPSLATTPLAAPAGPTTPVALTTPTTGEPRKAVPGRETAGGALAWVSAAVDFSANAEVGLLGAMAPALSPDFGGGVEAASRARSVLAPALRLSVHYALSAQFRTRDGTARFDRIAGRLGACPLRIDGPASLAVRPCVDVEVGDLRASGAETKDPAVVHLLWAALGVGVLGEIEPFRRFSLGVEVGATLPLARDRFYFDPDGLTAHHVDPVGFRGALFVGAHFL